MICAVFSLGEDWSGSPIMELCKSLEPKFRAWPEPVSLICHQDDSTLTFVRKSVCVGSIKDYMSKEYACFLSWLVNHPSAFIDTTFAISIINGLKTAVKMCIY